MSVRTKVTRNLEGRLVLTTTLDAGRECGSANPQLEQ